MGEEFKSEIPSGPDESDSSLYRDLLSFERQTRDRNTEEVKSDRDETKDEFKILEENAFEINRGVTCAANSWSSMMLSFEGIKQALGYFGGSRGDMIQKAQSLQTQREELGWKTKILEKFLSMYTLSEEDELILVSGEGLDDGSFFESLDRLRETLDRCKMILGAEDISSNAGEFITESMICVGTVAFSKLCGLLPELESLRKTPAHESHVLKQIAANCLVEREWCNPKKCLELLIKARSLGITDMVDSTVFDPDAKLDMRINFCFLFERSAISLETQLYIQGLERVFSKFPKIHHSECELWRDVMTECREQGSKGFDLATVISAILCRPILRIKQLILECTLVNSNFFHPCPELLFRLVRSIRRCVDSIYKLKLDCNAEILQSLDEAYELINLSFKRHLVSFARHLKRTNISVTDNTSFQPSKNVQKLESLMLYLCSFYSGKNTPDKVDIWLIETTASYFLNLIQVFATEECVNLPPTYLSVYTVNCSTHIHSSLKKIVSSDAPLDSVKTFISSSVVNAAITAISDMLSNTEFPERCRKLSHYCSRNLEIPASELEIIGETNLGDVLLVLSKLTSVHLVQELHPLNLIADRDANNEAFDTVLKHILRFYTRIYTYLNDKKAKCCSTLSSIDKFGAKLKGCIAARSEKT